MNKGEFRVLLVYPNLMFINLLPSNISILSACLKKAGFEVKLFDTTFYKTAEKCIDEIRVEILQVRKFDLSKVGIIQKKTDYLQDFRNTVESYKPNLIAMTLVEDTYEQGLKLLNTIKDTGIPTIVGGVFATFSPEILIKEDCLDMVCIGEGEETLVEVCERLREGKNLSKIKNLVLKKDGEIEYNPLRNLVDINHLPYSDFSIFEKERFFRPMQGKVLKMIPIEFDRGCLYSCKYCAAPGLKKLYNKTGGSYFRYKDIDRVIKEIEFYVEEYGPQYLYFNSETFLAMPGALLKRLGEGYKRIKLPFWCQSRVETITEEKVNLLKEMNCNRMSIGVEHGNEEFRKNIVGKRNSNRQILNAFEILRRYEIPVSVNNMIGFPDETRKLIFDTIELNRKLNGDTVNAFIFVPYRGTELHKIAEAKGYIPQNFKTGVIGTDVLNMPQISKEEVLGLQRTFCLYVKFPKSEWEEIKIAERFDKKGNNMFEKLRRIYYQRYFTQ